MKKDKSPKEIEAKNGEHLPPPKEFNEFLKCLEIQDVCLRAERSVAYAVPGQIEPKHSLTSLNFEYDWILQGEDRKLIAQVTGAFVAKNKESLAPEVELKATYFITYAILPETNLPDNDIADLFVRLNAIFHAVPYFREYFHSSLARLRFPVFTLPLLKPGEGIVAKRTSQEPR